MTAVVAQPTATPAVPQGAAVATVGARLDQYRAKLDAPAAPVDTEAPNEPIVEAAPVDGADDEAGDDDDKADDIEKPGEPKKLGRMAKIKERFRADIAERDTKIAKLDEENGKWREAGTQVLAQNRALAERVAYFEGLLEQAGVQPDPRDLELIDLRLQQETAQWSQESAKGATQRREQAQVEAQVQQQAASYREAIETTAQKAGVDPKQLAKAWLALTEANGAEANLDEVASILSSKQGANSSRPAPKTLAGTPARATPTVRFSSDAAGVAQFLEANGHSIR